MTSRPTSPTSARWKASAATSARAVIAAAGALDDGEDYCTVSAAFARRGFGPSSALDDWLAAERQVFGPAAELVEGKDKYVLKVALAGCDPDDVDVTATPDELFVKATFEAKKEKKGEREGEVVPWSEFRSGNVYRHIDLPRAIDTDKVAAKLKDGILTVEAPVNGRSARGNPPRTVAASTPGSRSISRARSIATFSGDCQVVTMDWLGAISGTFT